MYRRATRWRFTIHFADNECCCNGYYCVGIIKGAVSDLTEEQAQEQLDTELKKEAAVQDMPLVRKLYKATLKMRRTAITAIADCAVGQLVQKFPLMGMIEFVS